MCIMKTYETRGRGVVDPPPRRGNFTSHPPAGVMRLPRDWQRTSVESFSDNGRYVEYRRSRSRPRAIEYIEEPRTRARSRARSVSRRRLRGREGYEAKRQPCQALIVLDNGTQNWEFTERTNFVQAGYIGDLNNPFVLQSDKELEVSFCDLDGCLNTMASHPMQRCCVVGVKHEGKPQGVIKQIDDIRTYFAYPEDKDPEQAIVLMTDVLGMDFPNTQLIADQFAQNGYLTLIPDVFNGHQVSFPIDPSFDLQEYVDTTMPRPETVDPIYERVIEYLRNELRIKKLGGVGYCFGGKYVCRWLKEGGLDAGFIAHPSFVTSDEIRNIKGPLSIAAAETDDIFPASKRRETEDILKEHTVPYQLFLYSDVEHGFATKGDMSHEKARFAKEQAFLQAVYWLDEYVKKRPGV
ncbi:hypothetical protein AA0120_g12684 [Alternaria tenuissima]|nr:hypothetical protein AA0120_g12684 [Alternaria tenuissima]